MKTVELHYMDTAWCTGFSLAAPTCGHNGEEGYFDAGEYWSRQYVLPDGFVIAESEAGPREFYRRGEYFALGHDNRTPVLSNGHETIYLKRAS